MKNISIIGSASGKGQYDSHFDSNLYHFILNNSEMYIDKLGDDWSQFHLHGGGAPWADQAAVDLYLKHPTCKLTLHLPCKWDHIKHQFTDNGSRDWRTNPGYLLNSLHKKFSQELKLNTLDIIQKAINQGAQVLDHYKGFHARNLPLGKCDELLAFTFAVGSSPKSPGGTYYTWQHATCPIDHRKHFTLPFKQ